MKKHIALIVCISLGFITGCQDQKNNAKPQKSIEVKVERNDSITKAEVTTTSDINGKISKETIQIFVVLFMMKKSVIGFINLKGD